MTKKVFFKWLELEILPTVFEPQEDSFLLAENTRFLQGSRVLDLGCGCGIQGLAASVRGASEIVFSDLNPKALENAKKNAELNVKIVPPQTRFSFVQSDLFSAFSGQSFDCIIFNPPYVPSDSEKKWIEVDGGKNGREVLDRFLAEFPSFLKTNGTVFFLQSSLNGITETEKKLQQLGFQSGIVARQKLFFEELVVVRARK
jgi:release factor glutamine methyltransferase